VRSSARITALLAKGNPDPHLAQQLFEALFEHARRIRLALAESVGDEDVVSNALAHEIFQAADSGSLKKLLLRTESGERAIRSPVDIAERLMSLGDGGQATREILQLTAAVKKRLGKERDPGDGRVRAVKPRKGG